MLIEPVCKVYERLLMEGGDDWAEMVPLTAEEAQADVELLEKFEARQKEVGLLQTLRALHLSILHLFLSARPSLHPLRLSLCLFSHCFLSLSRAGLRRARAASGGVVSSSPAVSRLSSHHFAASDGTAVINLPHVAHRVEPLIATPPFRLSPSPRS